MSRFIRPLVVAPPTRGVAILLLTCLVVLAAGRARGEALAAAPSGPQNVVLIVADDMRYDSAWVMPTLGRLAERGVSFSRAYATTPLCCPSRASILTGRYARHHGVLSNNPPNGGVEAFDDRSTLATWLKAAGVRTGLIGRYLNGYIAHEVPPGWDYWFATGAVPYTGYYKYRITDNGIRRSFGNTPEEYSTRVYAQRALRFLERERERPFFLMVAPRAPHDPATPDPMDEGTFRDLELPLSPAYDEEDVSDKPSWIRRLDRLTDKEHLALHDLRRAQLESLLGVDRAIEGIVRALEADGRLDRTWFIFVSDNGVTLGEHRRGLGKTCAYEECARVPLVVVPPPGVAAPRTDDHLVANIDLAPTISAILGAEPAAPVDGRDLQPLLRDPATPWRDALLLEVWSDSDERELVALRTADRKYVVYGNGEEELYDSAADPHELRNLSGEADWAAAKADLNARLRSLLEEIGRGLAGTALP